MEKNSKGKFKDKLKNIFSFILKIIVNTVFVFLVALAAMIIGIVTYVIIVYSGENINYFYETFFVLINIGLFLNSILYFIELNRRRERKRIFYFCCSF